MKKQISLKVKEIALVLFVLLTARIYAQDSEVIAQLKNIEKGKADEALKALPELKKQYPNDPSVLFLDAVLRTNGDEALNLYVIIHEKFPNSTFADAALYRMFSYYYALGLYQKAGDTLTKLKSEYPKSPYIAMAERKIPADNSNDFPLVSGKKPVEAKPVMKTEEKTAEKADSSNFTVQAGAFLNIQNAQVLKKSLETDGYPVEITNKEAGGSILNVVLVGKFLTEKDADTLLQLLDSKYKVKGRIVPINK